MSIAVVIPCFRVQKHILSVIEGVLDHVDAVYVVDDNCPDKTGEFVRQHSRHPKVTVLKHEVNQGVGGAVLTGYQAAAADGHTILVKMDGDDQMDPNYLPALIAPILSGNADYTKGNRFFSSNHLLQMPALRLFGNAGLSFINKAASGYWDIMDPTNGYTALHSKLLPLLPLDEINRRYFFESDMLFRLGAVRAVVRDVPIPARYGDEVSHLNIPGVLTAFPRLYLARFFKRIWYSYFLRDLNVGSIQLVLGLLLMVSGVVFGGVEWFKAASANKPVTSGTVMLAALPIIMGFQLWLSAIIFDVGNVPREPLHPQLPANPVRPGLMQ